MILNCPSPLFPILSKILDLVRKFCHLIFIKERNKKFWTKPTHYRINIKKCFKMLYSFLQLLIHENDCIGVWLILLWTCLVLAPCMSILTFLRTYSLRVKTIMCIFWITHMFMMVNKTLKSPSEWAILVQHYVGFICRII